MTDILGETVHGEKNDAPRPGDLAGDGHCDVDLTMSLPASLTVTSGLNAMAHAAEALYAPDRNPVISLVAAEGICALSPKRFLASQLTLATAMHARTRGSTAPWPAARRWAGLQWRCITSFATRSAAASIYRTPRRTRSSCRTRSGSMRRRRPNCLRPSPPPLAEVQGVTLFDFAARLGAPMKLKELGLKESDLGPRAAEIAVRNPYFNPRPRPRGDPERFSRRRGRGLGRNTDGRPWKNKEESLITRRNLMKVRWGRWLYCRSRYEHPDTRARQE